MQIQKLFFLIDREAAHLLDGPHFNFRPYDYGPFDDAVYSGLEHLSRHDLVTIGEAGRYRVYSLSPEGYRVGTEKLAELPENVRTYLVDLAGWLRRMSFTQLVSTIYRRYPDMKANSVFRG